MNNLDTMNNNITITIDNMNNVTTDTTSDAANNLNFEAITKSNFKDLDLISADKNNKDDVKYFDDPGTSFNLKDALIRFSKEEEDY